MNAVGRTIIAGSVAGVACGLLAARVAWETPDDIDNWIVIPAAGLGMLFGGLIGGFGKVKVSVYWLWLALAFGGICFLPVVSHMGGLSRCPVGNAYVSEYVSMGADLTQARIGGRVHRNRSCRKG